MPCVHLMWHPKPIKQWYKVSVCTSSIDQLPQYGETVLECPVYISCGIHNLQSSGSLSHFVLPALTSCLSMERRCWNALSTSHAASTTHKTSGCCTPRVLCSTPVGDCFTCTMWSMQERCVEVDSELMGGPINCFVIWLCVS